MKPTAILSEAWRNIATGTTRALTCATILTLIAAGTAIFDLTGILALQHESRQWATSAAAIHIISGNKQIDPITCADLTQATGTTRDHTRTTPIQAAGALKSSGEITLTAMPSAPLDAWQATPGLANVLGIGATQQTRPGVWISSQLAATLHAREGDDLPTTQGIMHISAVFPWADDSRDQRPSYAIITPPPSTQASNGTNAGPPSTPPTLTPRTCSTPPPYPEPRPPPRPNKPTPCSVPTPTSTTATGSEPPASCSPSPPSPRSSSP